MMATHGDARASIHTNEANMGAISRRTVLGGAAAGVLGSGMVPRSACAAPVTLRIGYGGAAEEPLWLLIAKSELGRHHGKLYTIDGTKFQGADKRAQAFEADAIDLAAGGADGVIFAAAEGVTAKIIASICRESSRGFSTLLREAQSSIKSVPDLKGKIVGLNGFSTSGHLWLWTALGKHGLSDADVTIAPIPFSAMQEALIAGKIDVGEFPSRLRRCWRRMRRPIRYSTRNTVCRSMKSSMIIGKEAFLKKNSVAVRAFLEDLRTRCGSIWSSRKRRASC
jgi:hypothetical protein